MSKLERLIAELCPNGVEYKAVGEISNISRGKVMSKEFLRDNAGDYPVYSSQTENSGMLGKISTFMFEGEYLTWTTDGANAGTVFYRNGKFSVTNVCGVIQIVDSQVSVKFLYYVLNLVAPNYVNKGMGNPKLMSNVMAKICIPIPPLPVQEEIVHILDNFTELTAELTTELTARKKQYEYYRDKLLTFGDEVEWKTLGEFATLVRGNGLQKKDFTDNGIGCIHYGQIYTYYGTSTTKTKSFVSAELGEKLKRVNKNDIIITNTSENVEDVCKAVAWLGDNEIVTGGHATIIKHNENAKYLVYYTQTSMFFEQKRKLARGTKVIDVSATNLAKIKIPAPPLPEQERIVAILDRFDNLVNDITQGLPAEIEARQKQYEYYRDKLLTFKEIES